MSDLLHCPNCYWREWHGLPQPGCAGSHITIPDEALQAVESQGVIHWDEVGDE